MEKSYILYFHQIKTLYLTSLSHIKNPTPENPKSHIYIKNAIYVSENLKYYTLHEKLLHHKSYIKHGKNIEGIKKGLVENGEKVVSTIISTHVT